MKLAFFKSLATASLLCSMTGTALAQSDMSPVLMVESGPSDNPEYRRMVFVKYLAGPNVRVAYKAYNRTEFKQVQNTTPTNIIAECANGRATPLSQIHAFARAEADRRNRGQAAEVVRFCIKEVHGWERENRDKYLDPIFDGLPFAASLK